MAKNYLYGLDNLHKMFVWKTSKLFSSLLPFWTNNNFFKGSKLPFLPP
ncbi:MAG: hypothetical protein ACR5K4_00920 [Sodalis sp. (in: enterobacteria)]